MEVGFLILSGWGPGDGTKVIRLGSKQFICSLSGPWLLEEALLRRAQRDVSQGCFPQS